MATYVCFILSAAFLQGAVSECSFPEPAANFQNSNYAGTWYEIGKIQTKGGAFFEKNCVCTELGIEMTNNETGDALAHNNCREKEVTGKWTNVTGKLHGEDIQKQGKWLETIYAEVNYTVIAIDDNYSVEYDCVTNARGVSQYCVHVLSRTRDLDNATFSRLMKQAEDMNLNPQKLPITMTKQQGC